MDEPLEMLSNFLSTRSSNEKDQAARFLINALSTPVRRFIIPLPDGVTPYLERFILDEGDLSIHKDKRSKTYLHLIYQSDGDRDPHDHPFDFESTIIFGRYHERTYVEACNKPSCWSKNLETIMIFNDSNKAGLQQRRCRDCGNIGSRPLGTGDKIYSKGDVNTKKAADLHRIIDIEGPVVTLVQRKAKVREWGFQTPDGWEHHASYIARKFPGAQPTEVD